MTYVVLSQLQYLSLKFFFATKYYVVYDYSVPWYFPIDLSKPLPMCITLLQICVYIEVQIQDMFSIIGYIVALLPGFCFEMRVQTYKYISYEIILNTL